MHKHIFVVVLLEVSSGVIRTLGSYKGHVPAKVKRWQKSLSRSDNASKICNPVTAGPDRAMKINWGLKHLSCEDRLRLVGLFSLEKMLGTFCSSLLVPK